MSSLEFERIARIQARLKQPGPEVVVGIGDDAAVLRPRGDAAVWTVDVCVEGVHFRRDLCSLEDAGYRAFMGAASDVAAMGAHITGALLSLVLPAHFSEADLDSTVEGVAQAAELLGCPVIGGNLSSGGELSITHTVLGHARGEPVLRSGARPGDRVFATGRPGAAGLGLRALMDGDSEVTEDLIAHWRRPRARLDLSEDLASHATAALDLSDGLWADAGHLARASGVELVLRAEALPRDAAFLHAAQRLGVDPVVASLTGGEDYELLFTAPAGTAIAGAVEVGEVLAGGGVRVVDGADEDVDVAGLGGFDHFE